MTNLKTILTVLLLGSISWILFNLSIAAWLDQAAWFQVLALALFGVSVVRPVWAIGLFLILMPCFGGSKPGDLHTIRFLSLLSVLNFGLSLALTRAVLAEGLAIRLSLKHPLAFVLLVYWLVALLSLSNVNPDGQMGFLLWPDVLTAFSFSAANEAMRSYSWLSWVTLSQALFLAVAISNLHISNRRLALYWSYCLLGGLLISLVLGPLDFYDVIDLTGIRPEFYYPSYRHQRLRSLFGNPGWYAQYVTLATPVVLALLAANLPRWTIIIGLLLIMTLTEFTLILTNQRGGWLAYPLTLVAVWFAIYVIRGRSHEQVDMSAKARQAFLKIAVSVPITVTLSLGLVYSLSKYVPGVAPAATAYVQRAASIATNTNSRTAYWEPTYAMFKDRPLFGAGNESYAYQFGLLYLGDDPPLQLSEWARSSGVMQGSAHQMYFQALAGKGLVGIASLLALLAVTGAWCLRMAFERGPPRGHPPLTMQQRLFLMMGFSFAVALTIYGFVGEMFYAPINYVVFAFYFGLLLREVPCRRGVSRPVRAAVLFTAGVAFCLHHYWFTPSSEALVAGAVPRGCYALEGPAAEPERRFRWCGPKFSINAPVLTVFDRRYAMLAVAPLIPQGDTSLIVTITEGERVITQQTIPRGQHYIVWAPLPDDVQPCCATDALERVQLEVRANDFFVPAAAGGPRRSKDARALAIPWLENAQPEPVCYQVEVDPADPGAPFRWCPPRFAVTARVRETDGGQVATLALRPAGFQRDARPVRVRILSTDGELLEQQTLHPGVKSVIDVMMTADAGRGDAEVQLIVEVDDAFVPAIETEGASSDGRLLAVRWYL